MFARGAFARLLAVPFVFASAAASAQWTHGIDDEKMPYMAVANDSGNLFGQWCNKEDLACFWMIVTKTKCEQGSSIPGLLNSPANNGATSVRLLCSKPTTFRGEAYHRMLVAPFDNVTTLVKGQSRISLAVPMADGSFTVMRYDISGIDAAIRRIDLEKAQFLENQKNSTRDQRL